MESYWVEVLVGLLTAGVFSLIGFVWKFSHKVTRMDEEQRNLSRRIRDMEQDHDKAMDRMYSIAKSRGS